MMAALRAARTPAANPDQAAAPVIQREEAALVRPEDVRTVEPRMEARRTEALRRAVLLALRVEREPAA